jgi:hypothetical protein
VIPENVVTPPTSQGNKKASFPVGHLKNRKFIARLAHEEGEGKMTYVPFLIKCNKNEFNHLGIKIKKSKSQ